MKGLALCVLLLLAVPAAAQDQEPQPGLSDQDLARLTLAISQEFDLLEQRLTAHLDAGLLAQEVRLTNLTAGVD